MSAPFLPSSPVAELHTLELTPDREALLQRFFEANPEYYWLCNGEPAQPGEAHKEIHEPLPEGWPFTKKWLIGYADASGELVAMANVVSDLLAPRVWHVGYFLVSTSRHGSGLAHALYAHLESWMRASGAEWLRLGVLACNPRGDRFWARHGYTEVRRAVGVPYGKRTHTLSVRFKPLAGGTIEQYRQLVPRDARPSE